MEEEQVTPKRPRDVNELAKQLVDEATGEHTPERVSDGKDPAAKYYGKDPKEEKRYSPMVCTKVEKQPRIGDPDTALISTSFVERQNLTMRMGMRRMTRLTNAFSKKVENLAAAVSLHFMFYNFARPHTTLSKPYATTPAMAAGVADHVWTLQEIAGLLD